MSDKDKAAQFGKTTYEAMRVNTCQCTQDLKEKNAIIQCQSVYPNPELQEFCKLGILVAKESDPCKKKK